MDTLTLAEVNFDIKELKFDDETTKHELDNSIFTYNGHEVKCEFRGKVYLIHLANKEFNNRDFINEVIVKYGRQNIKFYKISTPIGDNLYAQLGTDETDVKLTKIV